MRSSIKTAKQRILSLVSSSFLLFTLTSLDFLSFGGKMLSSEKSYSNNVGNVSATMFLYSTIAAQFVFGIFSGLGGVCAGAIFEAQKDTRKIHELCFKMSSSLGEEISTTYACIFLSTALFALFSYILKRFRIGNSLRYIPVSALYGVMVSIGIMSIECGYEEIYSITWKHVHWCFGVAVGLALSAVALDVMFPTYFLIIPAFSLGIFTAFYIVFGIAGKDTEWMRSVGLIPRREDIVLGSFETLGLLKIGNINVEAIKANLMNILGLSLFNLVHIAVNVPSFAETFGMKVDLNKELGAQAVGNIVSAFLGYPTYFICSTSIYFNKSGGRSRVHSLVGAVVISSLLAIGRPIRESIPLILSGTIPMFIGFGFLYSYLWLPMFKLSWMDLLTLVMSALVSWYITPISGLLFGMVINLAYILGFSLRTSKSDSTRISLELKDVKSTSEVVEGEVYRTVDLSSLISFGDINESVKAMKTHCRENILFDLRGCGHLGVNANIALEEVAEAIVSNGYKVLMVGNPSNLYTHLFKRYMIGPSSITQTGK
ncbi:sulfate permease-like protein [Encephalitozoon hellem ATCC 50504]|uniref:Sulfate transporter protein n=1 Tax=Encephalitozoon hellem TaxID=27973 RepID=A0A9Q9C3Z0_ENCHE|nr:sulfate permease-like protein [Encephalitozoon hellem ATCC 50504]AFM98750.1 sulfate permease-like protein [Encephalitozoon hellem ATCC 50504]UTX43726.1 sulfate transporter protein [Encephalitozoon hellem]WEL39203.1 sulfate transporter protein [Encephalitozoon hellem]|eukprot:XP_003887731.1 sulfate permease-like protein [Encephalitozoon hellem ATCC 50504]